MRLKNHLLCHFFSVSNKHRISDKTFSMQSSGSLLISSVTMFKTLYLIGPIPTCSLIPTVLMMVLTIVSTSSLLFKLLEGASFLRRSSRLGLKSHHMWRSCQAFSTC